MINLKDSATVQGLVKEAFETATSKGWHETSREFGTVIALMQAEVSEAYEAILPGGQNNLPEELADVLIRMYDACGEFNIPLHEAHFGTVTTESKSIYEDLLDIHLGLSLALEAYRAAKEESIWTIVAQSFANIVVIICSVCDVSESVLEKMEKNKNRPYRHGGKRA